MIVVIDYGMGNLHSIAKAIEYVGGEVIVSNDPHTVKKATKVVLPGVGAFRDGIRELHERNLSGAIYDVVKEKKPLLGICLGMQLLAKKSYEFGEHEGLGIIDAEVKRFTVDRSHQLKVPHVGWNSVTFNRDHPLLAGIKQGADFYFVHSYYVQCATEDIVVGTTEYGQPFASSIATGSVFATQFHPEKSQKNGLQLLENFVRM